MINARAWPVRAMYILLAAALAISLFITAVPASEVSAADADEAKAQWEMIYTPTTDDWVLGPGIEIHDYALADDGNAAYAVVAGSNYQQLEEGDQPTYGFWLLKSTNGAATWKDITKAVRKEIAYVLDVDEDVVPLGEAPLFRVATDGKDADFVAVALEVAGDVHVFFSTDGGATFLDSGEVLDGSTDAYFEQVWDVFALAVSLPVSGKREVAIGGEAYDDVDNFGGIFRCTVDEAGWSSKWVDARYQGWDNYWSTQTNSDDDITSTGVVDIRFSPNWDQQDLTILVATVAYDIDTGYYGAYLQSGTWKKTGSGWNEKSSLVTPALLIVGYPDATGIKGPELFTAGIALPSDFFGTESDKSYAWVWVNYYDALQNMVGEIFWVQIGTSTLGTPVQRQIPGKPWLTNVSYEGTVAEGKAIAGVLGDGTDEYTNYCQGVQVWRKSEIKFMDICCGVWTGACKPPTGRWAMSVAYVSADKAYAVAVHGDEVYEESAWSVSFDDGNTWNQLSLVDTFVHYISDVAVSPDCNKVMLVTVNDDSPGGCDSVWLKAMNNLPEAEEYTGYWVRTWSHPLTEPLGDGAYEQGLLRLAPEEETGETVYLVDRMNDTVYWNEMETWWCWKSGTATVSHIVDLAVSGNNTIYALDLNGQVAMSDNYAKDWQEPVDSQVDQGWTIAVWDDDILVGGQDGDWNFSADGGETWIEPEPEHPDESIDGLVTVAFDTYYDTNKVIYAALGWSNHNGIYRWVIDDSTEWKDLHADPYDYTGLVLDRPGRDGKGNPMTKPENGGVLYASYVGYNCHSTYLTENSWDWDCWNTGVARCLNPAEDVCCGETSWDYLTVGLTEQEQFSLMPDALKICGCTDAATPNRLFAIDGSQDYGMVEGELGTVWTFVDCYAKKGVDLTAPADGATIPAGSCCPCAPMPFASKWDRPCDACVYEIEIALDEDFSEIIPITGENFVPDRPATPAYPWISSPFFNYLSCGSTYYWRVRASYAETGQQIHSWWSEPRSFTIGQTGSELTLLAPAYGASGVLPAKVAFAWSLVTNANKYTFVLSTKADLSGTPVDSATLTGTAFECTKILTQGTPYYWQVTAWKDTQKLSTSSIGTFTTKSDTFCCPLDGLCFATSAELAKHNQDVHRATPFWVWVVIAIGAVLVIVVVVLIFRTRRV